MMKDAHSRPAPYPGSENPKEFVAKVNANMKDFLKIMDELVTQNAALRSEVEELKLDVEDAKDRRRELQKELREMERNKPSKYNLVLIDGDGMIFSASLLAQGHEGGRIAAEKLRSYFAGAEPTQIRVFANLDGLSAAARGGNLVPDARKVREFFQGFSDPCNPHCYFVDVGAGKEKADHKLNEALEWHLKETGEACQTVLLGVSHDNGYARSLQKLPEYHHKIRLLQGPPFEREIARFVEHGMKTSAIANLFEKSKITVIPTNFAALAAATIRPTTATLTTTTTTTTTNAATTASTGLGTYAVITASGMSDFPPLGPPRNMASGSTPPPSPPMRKSLLVNSSASTKKVMYTTETFSKIRSLDPRPCNNYYLRDGDCWYGEVCTHSHAYKFNAEEIAALRAYVERIPCKKKEECTDADCYYGH